MNTSRYKIQGSGLGLRRSFLSEIIERPAADVDFFEVAPENWIPVGGKLGKQFRQMTDRFDFVCHGLSLSIGSTDPLDENLVLDIKRFMSDHGVKVYSEHLSYCSKDGHLYDLMPIPFTWEAVEHVSARIRRVQEILEQKIALENVSYYAAPGQEMDEITFFTEVIKRADCDVLLDINNIYVNSVNHRYDPEAYLKAIPEERIAYAHIAGHYRQGSDFLVDTHGAEVIDPVWKLLGKAYQLFGVFPTLLERDFAIPPLTDLVKEVAMIKRIQRGWQQHHAQQSA